MNIYDEQCKWESFLLSVCAATIEKFAKKLPNETKQSQKLIEVEFKKFCKSSKSKENRLVSISLIY